MGLRRGEEGWCELSKMLAASLMMSARAGEEVC